MKTHIIKAVVFSVVFILIYFVVQYPFRETDDRIYQTMEGFYQEQSTLDAVMIGASNIYSSWEPAVNWNDYGSTIYTLSIPGLPTPAIRYMLQEARKTQPDALYILSLNGFRWDSFSLARIHSATNYMRPSMTKSALIEALADDLGIEGFNRLEFYFPIIRFHSNWNQLDAKSFHRVLKGMKGSMYYGSFLKTSSDVSASFHVTDESESLSPNRMGELLQLVDYCEKESVHVLFVITPQVISKEEVAQLNTARDYISTRGFDVLDLRDAVNEIGLDLSVDYYNERHTNIHGALKIMNYLGAYLQEHYGFTDKRGDPAYASWDEASAEYKKIISPYTLDFERTHAPRDNTLDKPVLGKLADKKDRLTLTWKGVENADGYFVYRKAGSGNWKRLAKTDADTTSYADSGLKSGNTYTYTVVPYARQGDEVLYGRFDPTGIGAKKA